MSKKTKLSEIEKRYGVDFGMKSDIQLSTWLTRIGYPSLARVLRVVERKLDE